MKTKALMLCAILLLCLPAFAQFGTTMLGPLSGSCNYSPTIGIDKTNGTLYPCGDDHIWGYAVLPLKEVAAPSAIATYDLIYGDSTAHRPKMLNNNGSADTVVGAATTDAFTNKTFDTAGTGNVFKSNGTTLSGVTGTIGTFQGTTSTPITDGNFNVLAGPSISLAAGTAGINLAGKKVRVEFAGVYTNAAASLLNVDVALCTISGCATGTVLSPAGCVVTTTNQANNLTNGQFRAQCDMIVAATGATATLMAKAIAYVNLGAATSAVSSVFQDTATAVSNTVDLTVAEFVHPRFKFTTSNAGNSATLQSLSIEVLK